MEPSVLRMWVHTAEENWGPLSEITTRGMPKSLTTLVIKTRAVA